MRKLDPYIAIITPAKNEAQNVFSLVQSVANQTVIPNIWIFVNDDSTDNTEEVFWESIQFFKDQFKAVDVKCIKHEIENKEYALGNKYSTVVRFGLDYLESFQQVVSYNYVGILDCDVVLPSNYYEKLLNYFNQDDRLGIASAGSQIEVELNGSSVMTSNNFDHAPSGFRLWRRECFEDTGYYISISQDSVSEARAIMLGWRVRSFPSLVVYTRKRGEKFNYSYYGKSDYVRWISVWFAIAKTLLLIFRGRKSDGLNYCKGYWSAYKDKSVRIHDELAKRYFKNRIWYKLIRK